MGILGRLFSSDTAIDDLVVGAVGCLTALVGFCGYDLVWLHNPFNPINFGGACAAILGAAGGARRLRDGIPPPQQHIGRAHV